MGADKALLEIEGVTLLARAYRALEPVAAPIVVVADRPDRYTLAGSTTIGDLYPGSGPVGGIVTALSALPEGVHVVVACDMPFLQTSLIALLLDACTSEWDAVVPRIGSRPEPLCAVYRTACLEALTASLLRGERAAHIALEGIRTRYMEESDIRRADPELRSFINLNTPDDARGLSATRRDIS